MPISLDALTNQIDPSRTVLFLGSGSSIPSGAPSVDELIGSLAEAFSEDAAGYDLAEISGVIEHKTKNRKKLIKTLRKSFSGLKPTGGIENLPLYQWRSIFTTNYDRLVEEAYEKEDTPIEAISSNFDFGNSEDPLALKLFKVHGTIEKDTSDGFQAPIILTSSDYEHTSDYRERIYDRLRNDLNEFDTVIIGHSLADRHLREIVDRAAKMTNEAGGGGKIYVLSYEKDENRALLLEGRGLAVAFGGIDEFFHSLSDTQEFKTEPKLDFDAPLSSAPKLRPITVDVSHAVSAKSADAAAMYNGWPAGYAEVATGLTYPRAMTEVIVSALDDETLLNAVLLAPSGYGKTTCARQIVIKLREKGYHCFEHASDQRLLADEWIKIAEHLSSIDANAVLFIDDAHHHLFEINALVKAISSLEKPTLRLLLVSSKNIWSGRVKAAPLFKQGREFHLKKLSASEIDNLLNLLDHEPRIRRLVSPSFGGFSRFEKRRRLQVKCAAEPFVCLRNIFDSETFDHIILREFAELRPDLQEIYRVVAAMENAGVRVHRQLVIRMLGISAEKISSIIADLEGIITEYTINAREAVYGWRGRHQVIVKIVADHKFYDTEKVVELFDRVIDSFSPSYDIEIKTIRDICSLDSGIRRIPSRKDQNRLLQRLISIAPNERIPRHRLINNLLADDKYEQAETEIRIFENDFSSDGVVARYKIALSIRRSKKAKGLMVEDKAAILYNVLPFARTKSKWYKDNKYFLREYASLGLEIFKLTGDTEPYDAALDALNDAHQRIGDPEIATMSRQFEAEMRGS